MRWRKKFRPNFLASFVSSPRADIVAMRFEEKGITREKVDLCLFAVVAVRIISMEKNVTGFELAWR